MTSLRVVAASVAVASVVAAAPQAADARSAPTDQTVDASHTWGHRLAPQLVVDGSGDELLVMGVPDGKGGLSRLVATSRPAGGDWGPETTIARGAHGLAAPVVAMNQSGEAVVAWSTAYAGGSVHVRVRSAGGSWGATQVFRRIKIYGLPQVVVDDAGDAVVAADQSSGSPDIAVLRHGTWTVTRCPGYATPSVGLDRTGVVYAVTTSVDHGGLGDVYENRLGLDGRWSRSRHVTGVSRQSLEAQLVVSDTGHLVIAVGYASRRWKSTYDGDAYFTSAYAILRQRSWAASPRVVERKDGVDWLELSAGGHGGLRMTYTQWGGRVDRKATRIGLRVQQVGARHSFVLDHEPARWVHGGYDAGTVVRSDGRAFTWWQAFPLDTRRSGDLHLTVARPSHLDATGVAADSSGRGNDLTRGSVDLSGQVAWTYGVTYRKTRAFGITEHDGSVAVGAVS